MSRSKRSNNSCMTFRSISLVAQEIPTLFPGICGHQHETLCEVAATSYRLDSHVLINMNLNNSDNVKTQSKETNEVARGRISDWQGFGLYIVV